jgi:hypothetical protein
LTVSAWRYFFNIHGARLSPDEEGEELRDNQVAWKEATIIANIDGEFRPGQEWALEVADEHRKPLYVIRISAQEMK